MEAIVPALMRVLCHEAHSDAGVVLWFDSRGEVANLYAQNLPPPGQMAAWFAPSEPPSAASLLPLTARVRLWRSELVEICADDDVEGRPNVDPRPEPFCPHRHLCAMAMPTGDPMQRLCCAVVRHGAPVASLMLYRPATATPFSSEERTAVKAAGRYLSLNGHSALANTSAAMYRASGERALLLCEPEGQIARASVNGYGMLAQASGCPINRKTIPDELERAGRDLIRHLLAEAAHRAARDTHGKDGGVTLINAWGLFRMHVFWGPSGPLGVLVERVEHLLVRLVAAMWHLDLSVQQGEVLLLLAQGLSHDRIADRMGVSHNTADYHIRQLYSKLGTHTREDAIAHLLDAADAGHAA
jgi:DNA-binding CsgD family transcriptional regulator